MADRATTHLIDNATPGNMAAAGVPFPLARWYHMIGRRLCRYSDWDVERIMDISSHLVVNQAALKLKQAPLRRIIDAFAGAVQP